MKKHIFKLLVLLMLLGSFMVLADENGISAVTITSHVANDRIGGNNSVSFFGSYTGNSSANITVWYNTSMQQYSSAVTWLCADITLAVSNGTWQCTATNTTFANDCTGHTLRVTAQNLSVQGVQESVNVTANASVVLIWDNQVPRFDTFVAGRRVSEIYKNFPYKVTASDNCDAQSDMNYRVRAQHTTKSSLVTRDSIGRATTITGSDLSTLGGWNASLTLADRAGNNASSNKTSEITFTLKGKGVEEIVQVTGLTPVAKATGVIQSNKNQIVIFGSIAGVIVILTLGAYLFIFRK